MSHILQFASMLMKELDYCNILATTNTYKCATLARAVRTDHVPIDTTPCVRTYHAKALFHPVYEPVTNMTLCYFNVFSYAQGPLLYPCIITSVDGMARMPTSRNTFSKPPNSQPKKLYVAFSL